MRHPLVAKLFWINFPCHKEQTMRDSPLPIVRVVHLDLPSCERFFIEDDHNRVWTGQSFEAEGEVLFAHHCDAALEAQAILKGHFQGLRPQWYTAPVFIEVLSRTPVSMVKVATYLSMACRLNLNTSEHGNGPVSSLVLPRIEWKDIQPLKEPPNV
jgi:hypothetical protein